MDDENVLEALKNQSLDNIDDNNWSLALQMAAADFSDELKPFVQKIITVYKVPEFFVAALFDKAAVPDLLTEQQLRKFGKFRQDSFYKQLKFASSREQPMGYADLICFLDTRSDWRGLQQLIGQYSLDPLVVLGVVYDVLCINQHYEWFTQLFNDSQFTTEQLLDLIAWRLNYADDWRPALCSAVGLMGKLMEFNDIYRLLGPDVDFSNNYKSAWENALIDQSGSSQFASKMLGSLDDPKPASNQLPRIEQRAYLIEYLVKFGFEEPARAIVGKFPLLVQMHGPIADYYNQQLLTALETQPLDTQAELLYLCGPSIARSPKLISRLCELIKELPDQPEQFRLWLLPAISLVAVESSVEEIWNVLKEFPQQERYALYTEWQFSLPKHYKSVKYALQKAEKETKGILKRISNENADKMLEKFASIAVANPFTALSVFIAQVESYDKIGALLLANPRFNSLAWDIFPLAILIPLSSGRAQQRGSFHDAKWVQALASFTGKLAARSSAFDCSVVISFVLKQLHQNNFASLTVLSELLLYMGGCMSLQDISISVVEQLSACKPVRENALAQLFTPPSANTVERLLSALKDHEIVLEVLLGLIHSRKETLFIGCESLESPKVLGHSLDLRSQIIHQYTMLLSKIDTDTFVLIMPSVTELVNRYFVPFPLAVAVWRPFLAEQIRKSDFDPEAPIPSDLQPIAAGIKDEPQFFSKEFYVNTWVLETYDIMQFKAYEGDSRRGGSSSSSSSSSSRMSDALAAKTHKNLLEKCTTRLEIEQNEWFVAPGEHRRQQMVEFFAKIILPRALYSIIDAVFASLFLFKLNWLGTRYLNTMSMFDTLFNGELIYNTIISCTADEAEAFGTFVAYIIKNWLYQLGNGNYNQFIRYNNHASDNTKFTACMLKKRDENPGSVETDKSKLFTLEEANMAVTKWCGLLNKSLHLALCAGEYTTIRNAITMVKVGLGVFFVLAPHDLTIISKDMERLAHDERGDISLAASSIRAQLQNWKRTKASEQKKEAKESKRAVPGGLNENKSPSERDEAMITPRTPQLNETSRRGRYTPTSATATPREPSAEPSEAAKYDSPSAESREDDILAARRKHKESVRDRDRDDRGDRDRSDRNYRRQGHYRRERGYGRSSHAPLPPPPARPPSERDAKRSRLD